MAMNQTAGENFLKELVFTMFAQKRVLVSVASLLFVVFVAYAFLSQPVYRAEGSFLVKSKRAQHSPDSLEEAQLRVQPVQKEDLFSEAQILTSDDVALKTVKKLVAEKKLVIPELPGAEPGADLESVFAEAVRASLSTEVAETSNVLMISMTWGDAKQAQLILDTLMWTYLAHRHEILNPAGQKSFFDNQVDNYLTNLKDKQQELLGLVTEKVAPDPQREIEQNLLLRQQLQSSLVAAERQLIETERSIELLDKALASDRVQLFSFIDNPVIQGYGNKLQDLLIQQTAVRKTFVDGSKPTISIARQIDDAYQALKHEVSAYRGSVEARADTLTQEIDVLTQKIRETDARNVDLRRTQVAMEQVNREAKLLEYTFETFYQRREQSDIQGAEGAKGLYSQVVILGRAQALDKPVKPKKKLIVVGGFLLACMTGFFFAVIKENFDHSFKRPEDVDAYVGAPMIFSLNDFGAATEEGGKKGAPSATPPPSATPAKSAAALALTLSLGVGLGAGGLQAYQVGRQGLITPIQERWDETLQLAHRLRTQTTDAMSQMGWIGRKETFSSAPALQGVGSPVLVQLIQQRQAARSVLLAKANPAPRKANALRTRTPLFFPLQGQPVYVTERTTPAQNQRKDSSAG
ncbi:GumC family protein [Magnetofaba australis]|nr:Wzz/FepE/Etk N-terminal domain-containing protein [Magnetofaba australis]